MHPKTPYRRFKLWGYSKNMNITHRVKVIQKPTTWISTEETLAQRVDRMSFNNKFDIKAVFKRNTA